jgi:hypothetical protein
VGTTLWTNSLTPTLQLSFSDGGSGLSRTAVSTDGGVTFGAWQSYATNATITLPNADGVYTIVVRVMDVAGNVGSSSRSLGLKRTVPTITTTQSAPTNAGSYDVGGTLVFTYVASDTLGVGAVSATLDPTTKPLAVASGATLNLYTLTAGAHSITVTATDVLGNVATAVWSFQVHATIAGLQNAVNYGATTGLMTSATKTSLLAKLASAQSALAAGDVTSAKSYLSSFVTTVNGTSSTNLNAAFGALLVNWAQDLINRL